MCVVIIYYVTIHINFIVRWVEIKLSCKRTFKLRYIPEWLSFLNGTAPTEDLLTTFKLHLFSIFQRVGGAFTYTDNENREWKFRTLMPIFLDAVAFHFPTLSGLQRWSMINSEGNIVYLTH